MEIKKLIKILACGCWSETDQCYINECGTERCPLVYNGMWRHKKSNGHIEADFEREKDKK